MNRLLIKNIDKLNAILVDSKILECHRLFLDYENESVPEDIKDQVLDGNTYLKLSNGTTLAFFAMSEEFTIEYDVLDYKNLPTESINVSGNSYWEKRIGKKILDVELLLGIKSHPFGIKLILEDDLEVKLEYISENEFTFDALIIG